MSKIVRSRHFKLLLYPDTHAQSLSSIESDSNLKYVGILHEGEKKADGEDVKAHWHLIISCENGRTLGGFSKYMSMYGIDKRFIRMIESRHDLVESRLYLLHRNTPNKKQYSMEDLFGNNVDTINDPDVTDDAETEEDVIFRIMELLDEHPYVLTIRGFLTIVCMEECFGVVRRMGAWSIKLLEEHNMRYGG